MHTGVHPWTLMLAESSIQLNGPERAASDARSTIAARGRDREEELLYGLGRETT
jgi:hypothetical protein